MSTETASETPCPGTTRVFYTGIRPDAYADQTDFDQETFRRITRVVLPQIGMEYVDDMEYLLDAVGASWMTGDGHPTSR